MIDLDQFKLREIALQPKYLCELDNETHVAVPLALLLRVTREFDLSHVYEQLRGPRLRR